MVRNIDITRADWRELVFNERNKEYGAYALRGDSNKRHLLAFLGVTVFALLVIAIPELLNLVAPATAAPAARTEVATLAVLTLPDENKVVVTQPLPEIPKIKSSIKYTVLLITEEVPDDQEILTQDELNRANTMISVATVLGNDELEGDDIADLIDHQAVIGVVDSIFFSGSVEQQPTFIGGDRAMRSWIGKRLRYPSIAEQNGVQGVVIVQFVIGSKGEIRDVSVARSADPSLDEEAIRMVSAMPDWLPGRQGGVPVPVRFSMPVTFKLQAQ
ncbi:MAG: energy transducer TonB [Odoribacteraceae bacterium]|jgi:protein TonB|nr:energy transducer TonB [Odoribacteraceae bacterium]